MTTKRYIFFAPIVLISLVATAQIKINGNSVLKARGTVSTNTSIKNASSSTDLSESNLNLQGITVLLSTPGTTKVSSIIVNEDGVKTLNGSWEVSNGMTFVAGTLLVPDGSKLIYTGASPLSGQPSSFVDGFLYYRGSGQLFFPIGTGSIYTPAIIENATAGEYGIRVVSDDPAFGISKPVKASYTGQYWEITGDPASTISLSLNGMDSFLEGGKPVVLEAPSIGGIATSLSGTAGGDFLTSGQSVSQPIVGVGVEEEFAIIIHDLITPFTKDNANDKLFIQNIGLTVTNKVKLLDKYGVVVGEWKDYSNEAEFDFQKFSPGNYVCVVEYESPGSSKKSVVKGMVTILKAN